MAVTIDRQYAEAFSRRSALMWLLLLNVAGFAAIHRWGRVRWHSSACLILLRSFLPLRFRRPFICSRSMTRRI